MPLASRNESRPRGPSLLTLEARWLRQPEPALESFGLDCCAVRDTHLGATGPRCAPDCDTSSISREKQPQSPVQHGRQRPGPTMAELRLVSKLVPAATMQSLHPEAAWRRLTSRPSSQGHRAHSYHGLGWNRGYAPDQEPHRASSSRIHHLDGQESQMSVAPLRFSTSPPSCVASLQPCHCLSPLYFPVCSDTPALCQSIGLVADTHS